MISRRSILRFGVTALLVLGGLGCGGANVLGGGPGDGGCGAVPDGLVSTDVVGVWRTADAQITVDLAGDGRFEMSGPPPYVSPSFAAQRSGEPDPPTRGSGLWSLAVDGSAGRVTLDPSITLTIGEQNHGTSDLYVTGSRGEPRLYTFDGDPDSCELIYLDRTGGTPSSTPS